MTLDKSPQDLKILLVEDNPEDAYLTRKILRKSGLDRDLKIAGDGKKALAALEEMVTESDRLPDLILLDINLPVMGGLELLRRLKQDSRHHKIPVVMLTSSNIDDDISRSYDLGASTYLVKPISAEALAIVVKSLF